jgi:outer membrane immunogenic protein
VTLSDGTLVNFKQNFNQLKVGVNYHFGRSDEVAVASTMSVKAPPVVPVSWTGFYAGAAIADRISASSWNTSSIGNGPGAGFLASDPTTTPAEFFSSSLQGRLYGGYNWQIAPKWVAGLEGDVGGGSRSNMTKGGIPGTFGNGANSTNGAFPGTEAEGVDSSSVKLGWDGTVRGKIGMLVTPNVLFYGTGGVAFQQVSASASCDGSGDSWCQFTGVAKAQTFSTVRTGWTAGAGLEAILTGKWIGKFEVRYADFGRYNNTFFAGTGDDVVTNIHVQTYTATAGIGYKFN